MSLSYNSGRLAWWDARWHPYGLRWSEAETIARHLARVTSAPPDPIPLLLLARFAGIAPADQAGLELARNQVADGYRRMGLFNEEEIRGLVDCTISCPSEEDYAWSLDNELGWVFSGDYPCYSIRNRAHVGGAEGLFPFRQFADLIERLTASR
jgi:hypothetical protein